RPCAPQRTPLGRRITSRYRRQHRGDIARPKHSPACWSGSTVPVSMHQTSVRFGDETWPQIVAHCAREGIPVAHFIREATMVQLAVARERAALLELEARTAGRLDDMDVRVQRLEERDRRLRR